MKNFQILLAYVAIFSAIFFWSCEKVDDANDDVIPQGKQLYYISNEGAFGYGNGSISLYYPDDNTIINSTFKNVNTFGVGDVVQSIYRADNQLFIMVNASNKIVVTDSLLAEVATIENISLPRYMISISEHKAMISCWGKAGNLKVINTSTFIVVDSISVGNGPEKMVVSNGKVFVCNGGGFLSDSIVSVVDIANFHALKIAVEDNPVDIVKANNQSIWVLCQGRIIYDASWQPIGETKASLVEINPKTNIVIQSVALSAGAHPSQLEISPDKSTLYFGGGFSFNGIYTFDIQSATLSTTPLINKSFYGFNVEPNTGELYCLESPSFSSAGRLIVYSPIGATKVEVKTGIGPNGILF